ncbi:MAG: hypothetical protein H8E66_04160 [Planctomycetes bacterium]|nr:hypothetical protein [Planctomycetota bacterium]
MSRNRFVPILLVAALFAQAVVAGWGRSHAHVATGSHGHVGVVGHSHHHDAKLSHEHPPLPDQPTDKDDCSVCRHLALAAILTLELESLAIGDAVELAQHGESLLVSTTAIGLHRPRSPPELS